MKNINMQTVAEGELEPQIISTILMANITSSTVDHETGYVTHNLGHKKRIEPSKFPATALVKALEGVPNPELLVDMILSYKHLTDLKLKVNVDILDGIAYAKSAPERDILKKQALDHHLTNTPTAENIVENSSILHTQIMSATFFALVIADMKGLVDGNKLREHIFEQITNGITPAKINDQLFNGFLPLVSTGFIEMLLDQVVISAEQVEPYLRKAAEHFVKLGLLNNLVNKNKVVNQIVLPTFLDDVLTGGYTHSKRKYEQNPLKDPFYNTQKHISDIDTINAQFPHPYFVLTALEQNIIALNEEQIVENNPSTLYKTLMFGFYNAISRYTLKHALRIEDYELAAKLIEFDKANIADATMNLQKVSVLLGIVQKASGDSKEVQEIFIKLMDFYLMFLDTYEKVNDRLHVVAKTQMTSINTTHIIRIKKPYEDDDMYDDRDINDDDLYHTTEEDERIKLTYTELQATFPFDKQHVDLLRNAITLTKKRMGKTI